MKPFKHNLFKQVYFNEYALDVSVYVTICLFRETLESVSVRAMFLPVVNSHLFVSSKEPSHLSSLAKIKITVSHNDSGVI